jgi:cytochrome P450
MPDPSLSHLLSAPGPALGDFLRSLPALRANPLRYIEDAVVGFGDVIEFRAGRLSGVLLNQPAAIQHVLLDNHQNYSKDTVQYNALAKVTGRGLLTSDGDVWLHHRRSMQPAFHRQRIHGFGPLMADATRDMLAGWENAAKSGLVVDVDQAMMELALEILGKALLGVDLRREAPALTQSVVTVLDHIVGQVKAPPGVPVFIPTLANRRFQAALRTLEQAVDEMIAAHQQMGADAPDDLLSLLIGGQTVMSPRQLRDEVITILIAGHETVASALTWACYLLSQNPIAAERMKQELGTVLGRRFPCVDDLPALNYTRRIFDETLRLYPPAWLITRKALGEDRVAGYRVRAGSLVIIGVSAMHHHPTYWPDPDCFDPDRFTPENSAGRPRFAYLPFGGGPRLCIGNNFALAEAPLVLAAIFQRFGLKLAPGTLVEPLPLVTLRPANGMPMQVFF